MIEKRKKTLQNARCFPNEREFATKSTEMCHHFPPQLHKVTQHRTPGLVQCVVNKSAVFSKLRFSQIKKDPNRNHDKEERTYPQCRPITSMMNVLWWEYAVLTIASIASMIRCRAESVPMVMSVPQKSLSIDPTMPTMCRLPYFCRCSGVISPFWASSSSSPVHSWRKRLAPVREPSPPITTRFVMPRFTRLAAALRRPGRSLKSMHRAEPITVPPRWMILDTEAHCASWMLSPPSTMPW